MLPQRRALRLRRWIAATMDKSKRKGVRSTSAWPLTRDYPTLAAIVRFGLWSLGVLKRTFFGIGGVALLAVVGLFVAGALVAGPPR